LCTVDLAPDEIVGHVDGAVVESAGWRSKCTFLARFEPGSSFPAFEGLRWARRFLRTLFPISEANDFVTVV
jgi:hypothetical protein